MKKIIYTAVAALSLVTTSTMAVAAAPAPAPVVTPLTQPASETVDGDNALAGISGLGLVLGVGAIATFIAVIVFAVKSTNNNNGNPVITPPTSP